jgi:type IV pilus assembly protein PilV
MKIAKRLRGVTLIEVLIALVIVAVGLLGIAKMQALAIASTRGSSMRSLIAIEAASIASAMHANRLYWSNVATAASTFNAAVSNTTLASSDTALSTQTANCAATVCSGVAMAAFDLSAWGAALNAVANTSSATIYCSGTPVACTINVRWQENLVAMNTANQTTQQNTAPVLQNTYSLLVQP